jgi:hypothetical protein
MSNNGVNLSPIADAISAGAIVGVFVHALPPLAAVIGIAWYLLEIYESKTVQGYLRNRRRRWYRRQRALHRAIHKAKTPPVS